MLHGKLKRPTISTLFQRPSEEVGKCDFRVSAGGGKKMMAIQTTKGITCNGSNTQCHTPLDSEISNSEVQTVSERGPPAQFAEPDDLKTIAPDDRLSVPDLQ